MTPLATSLSPEADRATLIRRATFDLIGLPPTPDEVRDFVLDERPDAYYRLIDRLLAAPHYGEHGARPWLDLCHYADTDGYLTDQLRPGAWRYRSWLLAALNADKPFDQFTIEQLAGDLLPQATTDQKVATGFLRQTLSNREGGADPQEFRALQVIDRATMVGEIWMGLTVGCARCHDHKYDPLSQSEFFSSMLFSITRSRSTSMLRWSGKKSVEPPRCRSMNDNGARWLEPVSRDIAELQQRWEEKLLAARDNPGQDYRWDRQWEVLGLIWGGGLGEGQLEGWEIVQLDPAKRSPQQASRLLDYFLDRGEIIEGARFAELRLSELNGKLKSLQRELPAVARAPSMCQSPNPRQSYIHVAGDFRDRGEDVFPDTPSILPKLRDTEARDRLALAEWLVSPEHPLTSRVAINRLWHAFFGRGLVETVGDFGVRGTPPAHPELLDWLASQWMRDGWSEKRMQRLIVTSSTYRQSSIVDIERLQRDPGNELYARQSALRLTADQIRDALWMTSGLWDARVDGPSVRPPQPSAVTQEGFDNSWEVSPGGDRYRRGLYTFLQRTSPFAMQITFDAPNPNFICVRRERSNTPHQALQLVNDPSFFEAAQARPSSVRLHHAVVRRRHSRWTSGRSNR